LETAKTLRSKDKQMETMRRKTEQVEEDSAVVEAERAALVTLRKEIEESSTNPDVAKITSLTQRIAEGETHLRTVSSRILAAEQNLRSITAEAAQVREESGNHRHQSILETQKMKDQAAKVYEASANELAERKKEGDHIIEESRKVKQLAELDAEEIRSLAKQAAQETTEAIDAYKKDVDASFIKKSEDASALMEKAEKMSKECRKESTAMAEECERRVEAAENEVLERRRRRSWSLTRRRFSKIARLWRTRRALSRQHFGRERTTSPKTKRPAEYPSRRPRSRLLERSKRRRKTSLRSRSRRWRARSSSLRLKGESPRPR